MKNTYHILLAASLTLTLFVGCELNNPLSDNTDLPRGGAGNLPFVAAVVPGYRGVLIDDNAEKDGIQATVQVTFSDYMDPATMTSDNVRVLNTRTNTLLSDIIVSYDVNARRLYIRNEAWSSSSEYLLTLDCAAIRNRYGIALDGDGDGLPDGTPYDDFLTTFRGPLGIADSCVATVPPRCRATRPLGRINNRRPLITVDFLVRMDTLTLKAPGSLALVAPGGSAIPLKETLLTQTSVSAVPTESLLFGNQYEMVLKSSSIKADFPRNTPAHLWFLDADSNGTQAVEPDFKWRFLVDSVAPPVVRAATRIDRGVEVDFSKLMDTLTLTPELIRISDQGGYVPITLLVQGVPGSNYVQCFFSRPTEGRLRVQVSHQVTDTKGRKLDSNGNGIGGEPGRRPAGDDYEVILP